MTDNSNNEIRGGGVKRDAGGDEKQLIKFHPRVIPRKQMPYVSKAIHFLFNVSQKVEILAALTKWCIVGLIIICSTQVPHINILKLLCEERKCFLKQV